MTQLIWILSMNHYMATLYYGRHARKYLDPRLINTQRWSKATRPDCLATRLIRTLSCLGTTAPKCLATRLANWLVKKNGDALVNPLKSYMVDLFTHSWASNRSWFSEITRSSGDISSSLNLSIVFWIKIEVTRNFVTGNQMYVTKGGGGEFTVQKVPEPVLRRAIWISFTS